MKKENFDEKVKKSLVEGTDYSHRLKEDIWNNIEKEIDSEQKSTLPERAPMKQKKGFKRFGMVASMAATLLFGLAATTTETGSAFIDHVKQFFEPEKVVTEQIEGIDSDSNVTLQEGQAGYVIYFDKENYSMIDVDGKDRIVFNQELSDIYPEVYMEISQVDAAPSQLATEKFLELNKEYTKVLEIQEVEWPLNSFVVHAVGGTGGYEWDDEVVRYYFFSNEQNGSFVVKQQYFLEAEEGHGARFDYMLEQFHIFDPAEN